MSFKKWFFSFSVCSALVLFGCGAPASPQPSADFEPAGTVLPDIRTSSTAAPASGKSDAYCPIVGPGSTEVFTTADCPGKYPECSTCGPASCGQLCCFRETECGHTWWTVDGCSNWAPAIWQRKSAPGLICHLDLDHHWSGVTIEINVAEPYEDASCAARPDRWKKYEKTQTSCSYWTGLTDKSECARRVQDKIAAVAAAGYIPAFTDVDRDECPFPRM